MTFVPFALVAIVVPFAFVALIQGLLFARGQAKLRAGVGHVAQWHVGAADWERFRVFDFERVALDPTRFRNDMQIREFIPPEGVDVIVGETSVIVDDSYHVLRLNGLPELRSIGWIDNAATPKRPPDCLEFKLAYPRSRFGNITYTTLRMPIPEAAFEQARKVYHHFAPAIEGRFAKGPIALRNPIRTLQACGALLFASLAAASWAWLEAESMGQSINNTETPMVVLIVAGAVSAFALILSAATMLLREK